MKKRLLAWMLTVAMIVSNLPMISWAADYELGSTFTASTADAALPTDIPEGTVWAGPTTVYDCGETAHAHDEDCYSRLFNSAYCTGERSWNHPRHDDSCYLYSEDCPGGGKTSWNHWAHTEACYQTALTCELDVHTHTDDEREYAWTLVSTDGDRQYREWWPVYWDFDERSSVTDESQVTVTANGETVKYSAGETLSSTALAEREKGDTADTGDVLSGGFQITVEPGYYISRYRLVCGNHTGCGVTGYGQGIVTGNTENNYTATLTYIPDESAFDHWYNIGGMHNNSNSNSGVYQPDAAPSSTADRIYHTSGNNTIYPFYLLIEVKEDTTRYNITYTWGDLAGQLTADEPGPINNLMRNAEHVVLAPGDGETEAEALGYQFTGWEIVSDGYEEGIIVEEDQIVAINGANITLVAQWEPAVSYHYEGEVPETAPAAPATRHYAAETVIDVEAVPEVEGYTFVGWTTDDVTVGEDGTFTVPNAPVVFTGYFEKDESQTKTISYTVQYYFNGFHREDRDVVVEETVWVNDPGTMIFDKSLKKDFGEEWEFASTNPTELLHYLAEGNEEDYLVEDGDVIILYYIGTGALVDIQKAVYDAAGEELSPDDMVEVGDVLTYVITVTNTGTKPLTNVKVTDSPNGQNPDGITMIAPEEGVTHTTHTDSGYSMDDFIIASLPVDDPGTEEKENVVEIKYTYKVHELDEGNTLINNAYWNDDDPNTPSSTDTTEVQVKEKYTLTVEHYADGVLCPGMTETYTFTEGKAYWEIIIGDAPVADTYNAPESFDVDGVEYAFDDPATTNDLSGVLEGDHTVKLYYAKDEDETGIPDKYEVTILYQATTGGEITGITEEVVSVYDAAEFVKGNLVLAETGIITATGSVAAVADAENYQFAELWTLERQGHWAFDTSRKELKLDEYQLPPAGEEDNTEYYAIAGETYIFTAVFEEIDKPSLSIEKLVGRTDVSVGTNVEYIIHVKNDGNVPLTNVVINDYMSYLDDGTHTKIENYRDYITTLRVSGVADDDYVIEQNLGSITIKNLAVGHTVSVAYVYAVQPADGGKTIHNIADAYVVLSPEKKLEVQAEAQIHVEALKAILNVEKTLATGQATEVQLGETIRWNIKVSNSGNADGDVNEIKDTVTITLADGTEEKVTLTPAELPITVAAGSSVDITASYTVPNDTKYIGASFTNAVVVNGEQDKVEEPVVVKDADLSVLKTVEGDKEVKTGDTVTWKIVVTNRGNAEGKFTLVDKLNGVDITTLTGASVEADTAKNEDGTYTVAAGGTVTFTVSYLVPASAAGTELENVAVMNEDETSTPDPVVVKNNYKVTYELQGTIPSGVTPPEDSETHVAGDIVEVKEVPQYDTTNYDFSGWHDKDTGDPVVIENGEFVMPKRDVTIVGIFMSHADITVEKTTTHIVKGDTTYDYTADMSAQAGDKIIWKIVVTNNGDKEGVYTLEDTLEGVIVYDSGNQVVTPNDTHTIVGNAQQVYRAEYVVKDTDTGSITNTVKVSSEKDEETSDPVKVVNLKVTDKQLDGTKTEFKVGETVQWTITITNTGDAKGTLNTADIKETVQYKDSTGNWVAFTGTDGQVTVDPEAVTVAPNGGTAAVTVSWVIPEAAYGKTVRNVAQYGGDPEESEEITVEEKPVADIKVTQKALKGEKKAFKVGETITWTVTVTNFGNAQGTLDTSTIVDTVKYWDEQANEWVAFSAEDGKVTITPAQVTVDPDDKADVTVTWVVPASAEGKTIKNFAKIDEDPEIPGDEEIEIGKPVLVAEKKVDSIQQMDAATQTVDPDDIITWKITVKNIGKGDGKFQLRDQLQGEDLSVTPVTSGVVADEKGYYAIAAGDTIEFTAVYTVAVADKGTQLVNVAVLDPEDTDKPTEVPSDPVDVAPYKVTYIYTGEVPVNAPAVPEDNAEYQHGGTGTIKGKPNLADYTFIGWNTDDTTVNEDGSFVVTSHVVFEGSWKKNETLYDVKKVLVRVNDETVPQGQIPTVQVGDELEWSIVITWKEGPEKIVNVVDELKIGADKVTLDIIAEHPVGPNHQIHNITAKYTVQESDRGKVLLNTAITDGVETPSEEIPAEGKLAVEKVLTAIGTDAAAVKDGKATRPAMVGETIQWTITVTNTGKTEGKFKLVDVLTGSGLKDAEVTMTGPAADKDGFHTIAAGADPMVFTAAYTVSSADGTLVNAVTLDDGDGDPTDDPTDESEEVPTNAPALRVEKTVSDTAIEVGDTVTYTIKIKNTGNVKLVNVVVNESEFSGDFTKISDIKLSTDDVTVNKADEQFVIADLDVAEEVTIEFSYKADKEGTLTNEVKVTGQPDEDDDDEPDTDPKDPGNPSDTDEAPEVDVDEEEPITPVGPKPELDKGGDHLSYIIGYPDGNVRPLGTITRAEVATIFFRLLTDESREHYWSQENDFYDVSADDWFNNAVSTMATAGIVNGYPDGSFRPQDPVSRAEFAAIATRFTEEGRDGVSQKYFKQYFKDVNKDDWYAAAVELAYELGWAQGYAGNYRPEDDMTRAEVMTMVNRIMEREVKAGDMLEDMIYWPDNNPNEWYYEAVQEATNSHTYERTDEKVPNLDFHYEEWRKLIENPDWAALERTWSEANSQN